MSVQWRPMEDAPKDGTEVIIETPNIVRVLAHYQPGGFCIEDHPAIDEGWYFWNGHMFARLNGAARWRPASGEPSGAEAVVREVSHLEGVVAACIPTVIDGHNRLKVARSIIDNLRYCGLLPTAPGAPEEGTEPSVKVLEALYDTANDALVTRDVWVERAMRALRLGVYAEATENGAL